MTAFLIGAILMWLKMFVAYGVTYGVISYTAQLWRK